MPASPDSIFRFSFSSCLALSSACWSVHAISCIVVVLIGGACRNQDAPEASVDPLRQAPLMMEFEVLERSDHPGHKTSDYSDCLYTARLRLVDANSSGGDPKLVMGAIPAFLDRNLQTGAAVKPGDRIRAISTPFDKAPERYRRMQTADRFGDYLLDYLLLTDIEIVATRLVGEVAGPVVAEVERPKISPARYVRGPSQGLLAQRRQARMEREKARIESLLQTHGGSWDAWMKQLKGPLRELDLMGRASQFASRKGNLYFNRLPLKNYEELCEDDPLTGPLGALRLLNAELHRLGIDLIVVPFPTKEDIHAGRFTNQPDETEMNPQRLRFHRLLLEHDIEVLDLAPALRKALTEYEFVYFDNRDVHPADGGIQVAGKEIAAVLRDYDLGVDAANVLPVEASVLHVTEEVPGFVLGAKYPATRVIFPQMPAVSPDVQRRVIFQGDSFLNVPSHFVTHATVADHAGRYLGFEPETVLREAGANLILQDLARTPRERLQGRQVLVFVFGPTRLRSPRSGLARADYEWHHALLRE